MRVRFSLLILLLAGIIGFSAGGCASRNTRQVNLRAGEYQKLLEKQKAGMPLDNVRFKEPPEMTVREYEAVGDSYLQQGNLTMAYVQYDKALRMDPTQSGIRYKRGLLFLRKSLTEDAINDFREILNRDTHYALAYEGMGQAFLKMKHIEEAEQNFRRAVALDHALWRSYNFLGIIYDGQERFEEAIAAYLTAITLQPDQVFLLNNLGVSYSDNNDYENAVRSFKSALEKGLSDEKIYNNLGMVLGKLGKYQEALEVLIRGGNEAKAYNNLGMIYLSEGKYEEAITSFEKAVELNPGYYIRANENLKVAQKALGEQRATSQPPPTTLKGSTLMPIIPSVVRATSQPPPTSLKGQKDERRMKAKKGKRAPSAALQ